jgi:proteasome lid subunit RPN8/RPN11
VVSLSNPERLNLSEGFFPFILRQAQDERKNGSHINGVFIMNTTEIQIPRKLTQQLLHHAQSSPENEVCGLIGAKNNLPCSCYPVANTAEQPENRFLLDAQQHIATQVTMREKGETLFAVYHSHPTSPALPSATDIALANQPEALHLIISLDTKGVLEMRGFKIADGKAREVILTLAK